MDSYKLLSVCWAMTWVCVPMVWGVWCDGEVSRLCQWSLAWPDQQSSVVFRPRPPPHACVTTRRQTVSCRGCNVSQPRHQLEVRVRSPEAGQRPETVAGWSAPPRCEQSGIIRVSCEQWAVSSEVTKQATPEWSTPGDSRADIKTPERIFTGNQPLTRAEWCER